VKQHWYCGVEGQQYGPFTWEQIRAMAAEGRIVSDSFVRREVDQQWFQAAQVPGLLPKAHAAAKKNGAASSAIGKATSGRTSDSAAIPVASQEAAKSSASIKRPKAVASHSSGGNPVGSVPVGRPVGAPAVATNAPPASATVTPSAVPAFAISVASPPAADSPGDQPEPAKKTSPLLIVGILGGAVALVGLIGIGVLVWSLTRPATTPQEQLASAFEQEMQGALQEMAKELEGNPQALPTLSQSVGIPTADSPAATAVAVPASAAEAAKVLKAAGRWTDVSQLRAVALNKLRLSVGSVWLAADEAGTRTAPGDAAARFVFVQLRLQNLAPVPRKYKSWNATAGTSVVLADQTDTVLSLVPASDTPAAERLAIVDIQPGQSVIDTLVFTAPSGSIEKLKLALAKSALAENVQSKTGSHFALEIPLEVLLAGGSSIAGENIGAEPFAASRSDPPPAAVIPPLGIGEEPMPDKPAAAPAPLAAKKKGDKPPSKEELNKQFEELSKKEGKPETPKSDTPKPEAKQDEGSKPEPAKPEASKPEAPKPEAPQDEAQK
jgi:hypothetical protein